MKGYMYILLCADGSYYTGSTTDLERRLEQHQNGEGANHTKKRLPVSLLYYEEYSRTYNYIRSSIETLIDKKENNKEAHDLHVL